MPMQRLEDVEQQLQALSAEFARQAGEFTTTQVTINLLKEADHRHDENIKQMKESTIKMEVQFNAIMGKFDALDSKIFSLLQQAGNDRVKDQKFWGDLLKFVLGGTLFALIGLIGKLFLG